MPFAFVVLHSFFYSTLSDRYDFLLYMSLTKYCSRSSAPIESETRSISPVPRACCPISLLLLHVALEGVAVLSIAFGVILDNGCLLAPRCLNLRLQELLCQTSRSARFICCFIASIQPIGFTGTQATIPRLKHAFQGTIFMFSSTYI